MIVDAGAVALLLAALLAVEGAHVNNCVVFAGNQHAKGSACQSWWYVSTASASKHKSLNELPSLLRTALELLISGSRR